MKLHPRIKALSAQHAAEMASLFAELTREKIMGADLSRRIPASKPTKRKRGRPLSAHSVAGVIRAFIERHPFCSLADIKRGTGIDHAYLNSVLQRLKKAGHVQVRGERKRYRYALALKAVA
jgi:hypothetical protein